MATTRLLYSVSLQRLQSLQPPPHSNPVTASMLPFRRRYGSAGAPRPGGSFAPGSGGADGASATRERITNQIHVIVVLDGLGQRWTEKMGPTATRRLPVQRGPPAEISPISVSTCSSNRAERRGHQPPSL